MKIKSLILSFALSCFSLFGTVEHSIIPRMDQLVTKELKGKIDQEQLAEITGLDLSQRLRVMSFNMLFNLYDSNLDCTDRWENRKSRVIEYVQWAQPDVIGSQELQADQVDDLLQAIGDEYAFYGNISAIFYRKDRLELVEGNTTYFAETSGNVFTVCRFKDKKTGCEFLTLNTHLTFGNIERRACEARALRDFLLKRECKLPVLVTGDFNTFSFRQELDLPFYDGDKIVCTIEEGRVTDSFKLALFGHFGPISTTNYCSEKKISFCSEGEPGIILDHIFVSGGIKVLAHGIDSAKVDGHFPSDHFPVLADVVLSDRDSLML